MAYPDVGPVMLLSEASVKNLSNKLEKEVTVERFRPNIVISDCEAFEEVCGSALTPLHDCKMILDIFQLEKKHLFFSLWP